jgi:uncharacterized protein (UPF0332 family)/predicted nucleotidyltransferase
MKSPKKKSSKKISLKDFPTLNLASEQDIAMDFAQKVYQKFSKMIKSVVLFGSTVKKTRVNNSDIDVIIIVDDVSVTFDEELIAWYREELGKIIASNPYKQELHINTVKLSTWWNDLMKGDPVLINIIRYGEALLDFGGFFNPLKILLKEGKIQATPEAIYTCLQRAPQHLARSRQAQLSAIEGVYWAMVDSAHALLMSAKVAPASPEHIAGLLKEKFVDKNLLNKKYVEWYNNAFTLHKEVLHGRITDVKGENIDSLQAKADEFIGAMANLIKEITIN